MSDPMTTGAPDVTRDDQNSIHNGAQTVGSSQGLPSAESVASQAPTAHAQSTDSPADLKSAQAAAGTAHQASIHKVPADSLTSVSQPIQPPTSDVRSEPISVAPVSSVNGSNGSGSLVLTSDPSATALPAPVAASEGTGNPFNSKEEKEVGVVGGVPSASTGSIEAQPTTSATQLSSIPVPPASTSGATPLPPSTDAVDPKKESIISPVEIKGEAQGAPVDTAADPKADADRTSESVASTAQPANLVAPTIEQPIPPTGEAPNVATAATTSHEGDVVMTEPSTTQDAVMADGTVSDSVAPAAAGLGGVSASLPDQNITLPNGSGEPPAKRQKTDPAASAGQPVGNVTADPSQITMTQAQIKFAQNSIKSLKQRPEAPAFLQPVDPVALNIPQYRQIIEKPMDLGTIDVKLAMTASAIKGGKATEKTKQALTYGLDPARDVYNTVQEWEQDVRLVFANCIRFNGPDHVISQGAKALELVFEKQLNSMPVELPAGAGAAAETSGSLGTSAPTDEKKPRRPSNPVPAIRRSSSDANGRPKREIHPPAPRDLPYADEPQSASSGRKKKSSKQLTPRQQAYWAKVNQQELNFCAKIIDDLVSKHADLSWVFVDLVSREEGFAAAYYATIKRPIAFRQILDKHRRHEYGDKDDLISDVRLLFQNCYTFNPPHEDVHKMGKTLEGIFNDRLQKMPKPKPMSPEPDEEDEEDAEYDLDEEDRIRNERIRQLEEQLAELRREAKAAKAKAVTKKKPRASGAGGPSSSKKASSSGKSKSGNSGAGDGPAPAKKAKKSSKAAAIADDGTDDENDIRAVTWEQKEELASKITQLSDERLDGALKIISEDKPPSANEEEEIELDIEDLSPRTLYKLYRYVVKPKKKPGPKPGTAKGGKSSNKAATGGKKRKNLDEEAEAARIARLQEQLQSFDRGPEAGGIAGTAGSISAAGGNGGHDDLVQSDSSSGEEDSDGYESDY